MSYNVTNLQVKVDNRLVSASWELPELADGEAYDGIFVTALRGEEVLFVQSVNKKRSFNAPLPVGDYSLVFYTAQGDNILNEEDAPTADFKITNANLPVSTDIPEEFKQHSWGVYRAIGDYADHHIPFENYVFTFEESVDAFAGNQAGSIRGINLVGEIKVKLNYFGQGEVQFFDNSSIQAFPDAHVITIPTADIKAHMETWPEEINTAVIDENGDTTTTVMQALTGANIHVETLIANGSPMILLTMEIRYGNYAILYRQSAYKIILNKSTNTISYVNVPRLGANQLTSGLVRVTAGYGLGITINGENHPQNPDISYVQPSYNAGNSFIYNNNYYTQDPTFLIDTYYVYDGAKYLLNTGTRTPSSEYSQYENGIKIVNINNSFNIYPSDVKHTTPRKKIETVYNKVWTNNGWRENLYKGELKSNIISETYMPDSDGNLFCVTNAPRHTTGNLPAVQFSVPIAEWKLIANSFFKTGAERDKFVDENMHYVYKYNRAANTWQKSKEKWTEKVTYPFSPEPYKEDGKIYDYASRLASEEQYAYTPMLAARNGGIAIGQWSYTNNDYRATTVVYKDDEFSGLVYAFGGESYSAGQGQGRQLVSFMPDTDEYMITTGSMSYYSYPYSHLVGFFELPYRSTAKVTGGNMLLVAREDQAVSIFFPNNYGLADMLANGLIDENFKNIPNYPVVFNNHKFKDIVYTGPAIFALDNEGYLYSWGNNAGYKTGQPTDTGFTTEPTKIGTRKYKKFIGASFNGQHHALAEDNNIYALGQYNEATDTSINLSYNTSVYGIITDAVIQVTSNNSFTFYALNDKGEVYTNGANKLELYTSGISAIKNGLHLITSDNKLYEFLATEQYEAQFEEENVEVVDIYKTQNTWVPARNIFMILKEDGTIRWSIHNYSDEEWPEWQSFTHPDETDYFIAFHGDMVISSSGQVWKVPYSATASGSPVPEVPIMLWVDPVSISYNFIEPSDGSVEAEVPEDTGPPSTPTPGVNPGNNDWVAHVPSIPKEPSGPNPVISITNPEGKEIGSVPFPPGAKPGDVIEFKKDGDKLQIIYNGEVIWEYVLSPAEQSTFPPSGGYIGFYDEEGKPTETPPGGTIILPGPDGWKYKLNLLHPEQAGPESPFKYGIIMVGVGVVILDNGEVYVGDMIPSEYRELANKGKAKIYDAGRGSPSDLIVSGSVANKIKQAGYSELVEIYKG